MKYSTILVLFLSFIIACKKKDSTKEDTVTSPSQTFVSNGTSVFDVIFQMRIGYYKYNGIIGENVRSCHARWSVPAFNNEVFSTTPFQDMGNVSLNGTTFGKFPSQNWYYDTELNHFNPPYVWNISGTSGFSAFTFTSSTTYPVFDSTLIIPSIISKSVGFTIPLTNIKHTDVVRLFIYDTISNLPVVDKIVAGTSSNINFTKYEITNLPLGKINFIIELYNDSILTISGKKCNFRAKKDIYSNQIIVAN
jgi:hypothetical protein